jgi:hypothetical protein
LPANKNVGQFVVGAVGIVVIVIVLLSMTPTVVTQVQTMDTSGWNFTGHEGAALLLGLVPFIWIASILVAAAVGMFGLASMTGVRITTIYGTLNIIVIRLTREIPSVIFPTLPTSP